MGIAGRRGSLISPPTRRAKPLAKLRASRGADGGGYEKATKTPKKKQKLPSHQNRRALALLKTETNRKTVGRGSPTHHP